MTDFTTIPIIYHPASVLIVDDAKPLLNSLSLGLDHSNHYVLMTDPKKALDHLLNNVYTNKDFDITDVSDEVFSPRNSLEYFSVDFARLTAALDSSQRFDKIAVAIVDKTMPEMDGLEFCKIAKEKCKHIKLILLTGTVNDVEAVEAFNAGIIDRYVKKDDVSKVIETLDHYIRALSWQYFSELSEDIVAIKNKLKIVELEAFKVLFHSLCRQYKICEHYLIDVYGSLLLVAETGETYILLVRDNAFFKEICEVAQGSGASEVIVEQIKQKRKMPFSRDAKIQLKLEGDQWLHCLESAKAINDNYHYAFTQVDNMDILSFTKYLNATKNKD